MKHRSIALILAPFLLLGFLALPPATHAAGCTFELGFKAVHDLIPDVAGNCLVNEHHNPTNSDGLQETQHGLLVWRKADNWTPFTEWYHNWLNGPYGLEQRLNSQRFLWEADAPRAQSILYLKNESDYCASHGQDTEPAPALQHAWKPT